MEKVVKKRLVLTVTAAAVCVLGLPTIGQAATISATGLQNNDATVTDTTGQPVTGNYSQWENYQVNYQWSVLNSVKVANGDTTTVTLPDGLTANSTLDLPLVTKTGQTVGTFTIQKGATSGTITFNGRPSNTDNLAGTLSLYTQGTTGSTHIHNDWSINKIGWIVNRNPTGQPTLLTWNVAFNAASQSLGNVTITDTLGPNQTYVPGSVVATDGAYDSTGTLVSDGQAATPAVTTAGNQLTFLFTNVNTAVNMTYNAIPTITGTGQVWTNNAAISGKDAGNVTAQIAWGGAGSASDNLIPVATPSDPTTPSDPATTTSTTGTSTATSTSAAKTPSNPVTPSDPATTTSTTGTSTATSTSTTKTPSDPVTPSDPATTTSTTGTSTATSTSTTKTPSDPVTPSDPATTTSTTGTSTATSTSTAKTPSDPVTPSDPATTTSTTGTSTDNSTPTDPTTPSDPATSHVATTGDNRHTIAPIGSTKGILTTRKSQRWSEFAVTPRAVTTTMPHQMMPGNSATPVTSVQPASVQSRTKTSFTPTATDQSTVKAIRVGTTLPKVAASQRMQKRLPQTNEGTDDLAVAVGVALLIGLSFWLWKRQL